MRAVEFIRSHPSSQLFNKSTTQALKTGLADVLRGAHGGTAPLRLLLTLPEFRQWLAGGTGGTEAEAAHWRPEAIARAIVCKHGYDPRSAPVQMLVRILAGLTPPQRRAFLLFVTGAPRLPPGGFAGLSPRLTVVRKDAGAGGHSADWAADAWLPSCSTCTHFLKWPSYGSKAVARARLLTAIELGADYFALD